MDKEQKEILITHRVELVESLNMEGGLFTQLMAKKILNQRAVNNIKMKRTPEEQAEELLNFLPKKDCFDKFCEALIADEQEEIVQKYLRPAKTTETTMPKPATAAPTSFSTNNRSEGIDSAVSETVDAIPLKRTNAQSAISMIRIKEPDNNHLYIAYVDTPSPHKSRRLHEQENGPQIYEDNTRYVTKHFIAEESNPSPSKALAQVGIPNHQALVNPQSIYANPNISDPARYAAAFPQQAQSDLGVVAIPSHQIQAPIPPALCSSPTTTLHQHQPSLSSNQEQQVQHSPSSKFLQQSPAAPLSNFMQHQRPHQAVPNTMHSSSSPYVIQNHHSASTVNQGVPPSTAEIKQLLRPPNMTVNPNPVQPFPRIPSVNPADHYVHPHEYLRQTGVLPPTKGMAQIHIQQPALTREDSVDTMALRIEGGEVTHFQTDLDSGSPQKPGGSVILTAAAGAAINLAAPLPTSPYTTPIKTSTFQNVSVPATGDSDMDNIDLPDGCVNVKVEHSTRQFFMQHYKKSYPLRQIPRGLFLIINVDEVEGKPPRKGTNFDRDNLCNLLCQLHFEPVIYNDSDGLSAQEIVLKLRDFAKRKEHYKYDACFICLLSHGEEGYIFGTDGKRIPLDEIFLLFGNTNCKGLIGKPKIFIIQACRGGSLDKGVKMDEPDGGNIPNNVSTISQLPTMSDMLICYPTLAGYYAWRNRARGSWYIEAIVQVFMKYAKNEDICAMLNRVNQVVSRKVSECNQKEMNQMSQMSEYKSTLRQPHLYLFPGIGCPQL